MEIVTYTEDQLSALRHQMAAVQSRYPGLGLGRSQTGFQAVQGKVSFSMAHRGRPIEDEFDIELRIPRDYPRSPPNVYELNERLDDFDHLFQDGRLCLGAPVDVRSRFAKEQELLFFIEELVIPFLFAFSYKDRYGEMPFGELSHGIEGILEYYADFFGTSRYDSILLLKCLADGVVPPLDRCPCGSGRKVKNCHGPRLSALRSHQTAQAFEDELREVMSASKRGNDPHRKLLPRRLRRRLARELDKKKSNRLRQRDQC